jgi:DUF1365 family protein
VPHSCVYEGAVLHRRRDEPRGERRYRLFMVLLDLGELPGVLDRHPLWSARRPAIAWFRRADHLGDPEQPLDDCVRGLVEARTGRRPAGPVRLLTHLRYFGHCFNPVSFYYCYDEPGERVEAVVAEVSNTPWGERHAYVLGAELRGRFAKQLHVSPFMGMDQTYEWRVTEPGEQLLVQIESTRGERAVFDVTLSLRRRALSSRVLARHPLMTLRVVAAIYADALRLKARGARYHPNPSGAPLLGRARREHARRSRERAAA